MRRHLSFAFVVLVFIAACNRSTDVKRLVTPEGELLSVKGKYTLVLLSDDVMRRTFGPEWHRLTLFYGSNRAIDENGRRSMVTSSLRPLAKGTSILVISGDEWPDLIVPMYVLESRKQATFFIDTIRPAIRVTAPEPRPGEPMLSPDGRLLFR